VDTGRTTYVATIGSQTIELPVVALHEDLSIALLICVDHGIGFTERAGAELAAAVAPFVVDLVVSVATMGIPLAIEVSRSLGLDDYLILHKTAKIHLGDSLAEPLTSITTDGRQRLRLDPARVGAVAGQRVAVVDDVISTGASIKAALALLRRVGAEPVVVGSLVTEGSEWSAALGSDAGLVRTLGALPVFRPGLDGTLVEEWGA
jgi:adenine/guanine phosphoribosyltransferase-like PRPP-binding protein